MVKTKVMNKMLRVLNSSTTIETFYLLCSIGKCSQRLENKVQVRLEVYIRDEVCWTGKVNIQQKSSFFGILINDFLIALNITDSLTELDY